MPKPSLAKPSTGSPSGTADTSWYLVEPSSKPKASSNRLVVRSVELKWRGGELIVVPATVIRIKYWGLSELLINVEEIWN